MSLGSGRSSGSTDGSPLVRLRKREAEKRTQRAADGARVRSGGEPVLRREGGGGGAGGEEAEAVLHLEHGEAERARDVLEAAKALGQTVDEAVGALLPLRLPRQRVAAAVGDVGTARSAHQIVGERDYRLRLAERAVPLVNSR